MILTRIWVLLFALFTLLIQTHQFLLTGWTAFLQWLQAEMDACPWGSDIKDLVEGGLACPANISFPMSTTIYYAELVDKQ